MNKGGDVPQITGSAYASSVISPMAMGIVTGSLTAAPPWIGELVVEETEENPIRKMARSVHPDYKQTQRNLQQQPETMPASNRRIVQVFIADPNENTPLDKSVLYRGEQKLTDLNDTELFFEVPITQILTSYNKDTIKSE